MAGVKYLLLLFAVVTVHGTKGQEGGPFFKHLHEYVNRNVHEFIERALLESDVKNAAQIQRALLESDEKHAAQIQRALSESDEKHVAQIQRALTESDEKHAAQIQRALLESDEKHAAQIQRALLESDEKHAAQIASLRKKDELLIQQVKDELSKEHADDIVTLRNEFETQHRDLRMRLDMITHPVEKQEKGRIYTDHQTNSDRETLETFPDEIFGNTNRSLDETNGSSKNEMPSYMNRKASPISQIWRRNSGNKRERGNMRERTGRHVNARQVTRRQVTGETRVVFFATMEADNTHLGVNHDIVFQHVITNIGNAYNSHHGTFIAPVDGVYVFSCTLGARTRTYAHFMVNGDIVAKFNMYHDINRQSSQTVIVNLKQGYDVSVQNTISDQAIFGDKYSTFSGFLLYEDLSNTPAIVG